MFCKFCGVEMPDNNSFCPSCGKNAQSAVPLTRNEKWIKICIAFVVAAAIAGFCIIFSSYGCRKGNNDDPISLPRLTVEQYRLQCIKDIKAEIDTWARTRPEIVQLIESKHGTVTVDWVDLKSLYVHTYDNTGVMQDDASNVESIEYVIRFWWDGIFHQDGHTDVQFVFVPHGDDMECRKCCVVDTDALIDLDDPTFWATVGAMLFL